MKPSARTVNLAGREIGCSCHACAFFHSDDQFYKVMLPFIREGFTAGDRAVHIVDPAKRERHLETLSAAGVDAERSQDTRQLEVRRWEEAYLREGHFDQDAMLALIQEVLEEGRRQAFPMTRLVANMEWALEDVPGVGRLIDFENRLQIALRGMPDLVICAYDISRHPQSMVLETILAHPMALIGGVLRPGAGLPASPRDRILGAASELFTRQGVARPAWTR